MSILIFFLVLYVLFCFTLQKLFSIAGVPSNKAWIPGVNFAECCKLVGRPGWNAVYMLIPIYNIFFFTGLCVDLVRSFGKYDFWHSALAVVYAPIIFWLTGNDKTTKYVAPAFKAENEFREKHEEAISKGDKTLAHRLDSTNPYKKSQVREWVEAVVFAVFAAAFIRMFLIEAYVIPTSSMEGSLLVGDFLFVSKAHYGIRTPKTVVQIPLMHNRNPFIDAESYTSSPNLPYYRLPKLQDIQRMDPVVFNYPEGDTVFIGPIMRKAIPMDRTFSIHDLRRLGFLKPLRAQNKYFDDEMIVRPFDKTDFYIKRCVATSGDSVKIVDRQLMVNGNTAPNPSNMHYEYKLSGAKINNSKLDEMGVHIEDAQQWKDAHYMLTFDQVNKIKGMGATVEQVPHNNTGETYPHDTLNFKWTMDNFGPLYIPKAGATIQLTPKNMLLYRRVISAYEGNKVVENNGKVFINDTESTTYTFKWNYYWMMGDNRHNSEDSRVWGFVPETHVVGKPLFIWFSTKNANIANGIRWSRIFTTANKM